MEAVSQPGQLAHLALLIHITRLQAFRSLCSLLTPNALQEMPGEAKMVELTEAWRPYRSLGSWLMWRVPPPAKPVKAAKKGKAAAAAKQRQDTAPNI